MFILLMAIFLAVPAAAGGSLSDARLPPEGSVSDLAEVLDAEAEKELGRLAAAVLRKTSLPLTVITVKLQPGEKTDDYAAGTYGVWKKLLNRRARGVLVVAAPGRELPVILTGPGTRPHLTDELTGRILRESFYPAFRRGDYQKGIVDGVSGLAGVLLGTSSLLGRDALLARYRETVLAVSFCTAAVFFFIGAGFGARAWAGFLTGAFFLLVFLFPLGLAEDASIALSASYPALRGAKELLFICGAGIFSCAAGYALGLVDFVSLRARTGVRHARWNMFGSSYMGIGPRKLPLPRDKKNSS